MDGGGVPSPSVTITRFDGGSDWQLPAESVTTPGRVRGSAERLGAGGIEPVHEGLIDGIKVG
jgi:hypothetical protein